MPARFGAIFGTLTQTRIFTMHHYAFVLETKLDRAASGWRGLDQPKSLIIAQNERWRQA